MEITPSIFIETPPVFKPVIPKTGFFIAHCLKSDKPIVFQFMQKFE
jgi:hypothetical protein